MASDVADASPFRFFDNREKYLLFVTTTSEKYVIAERIGREFDHLTPAPPALRVFDAGMGDAAVLVQVMRHLHRRFPTVPHLVVGKEISLEDARLSLNRMADRFFEHPLTVFVVTNMNYREAPWLRPREPVQPSDIAWWDIALEGQTSHEFEDQIMALQPLLAQGWQTRTSARTGNPLYVTPAVMVLYRADQRFVLEGVRPTREHLAGEYDLVIAAQPYRARQSAAAKVKFILDPLARALRVGGRMVVVQATGLDPGMEIIRKIWPDEAPFQTPGPVLMEALRERLRRIAPERRYRLFADEQSHFQYQLHALPDEVSSKIGTSTLLAAWNAAVYVAQIEDGRLRAALSTGGYLEATREVLQKHGGLWFLDESFVVVREADAPI